MHFGLKKPVWDNGGVKKLLMYMGVVVVALYRQKIQTMKAFIKQLFFDKEIVDAITAVKASREMAYVQLISGRITMKEYIAIDSALTK